MKASTFLDDLAKYINLNIEVIARRKRQTGTSRVSSEASKVMEESVIASKENIKECDWRRLRKRKKSML
jgi:hypothetical protein